MPDVVSVQLLPVGTGIRILFRCILHVLPPGDIGPIVPVLLFLVVRGFHQQLRPDPRLLEVTVILFAFISCVYYVSVCLKALSQLPCKGQQRLGIRAVC